MVTSSHASSRFAALFLVMFAFGVASCSRTADDDSSPLGPLATVSQALTDTDNDTMDDVWEVAYFGNLSAANAGDADADGMTNGEEYLHGFVPTVSDGFDDSDGDRYPNVFEVRNGSDPNEPLSIPAPTHVVNGAGGGTHTTIGAAMSAANVANGAYQIIGIAPGVYTGSSNLRTGVTVASTKPKLLFIGLQGAAETIIDGEQINLGWLIQNSAVISSLTFRKTSVSALLVQSPAKEVRLVDLIVRDNTSSSTFFASALHASPATDGTVHVVGSTFLDNSGATTIQQINIATGAAKIVNTVVWSQGSGTMLGKAASATLTTSHCLVKGQTLTGTSNLAGSVDPRLRPDGHLLWDSPLRAAGGTTQQSRVDIDGEFRPSMGPDIGVDQFNDSDSDELADQWELEYAGEQTTLTSLSQDGDGDGLSNEAEYASATNPVVADTDVDGVSDGDEVLVHGSNPLSNDTDGDDMPDGWEISHGLAVLSSNAFDDNDGDRYPNVFEFTHSTDPSSMVSTPIPTYVVNGAGGGTHTTIGAAMSAANVANGAYQIIGIAPGVYTGSSNLRTGVTVASTKPKLLFIGLQGAAETIIDGEQINLGWLIQNSAVISSLTFRNIVSALFAQAPAKEVRFVDLIVRDNTAPVQTYPTPGLHVAMGTGGKAHVVGSTFLDNAGAPIAQQINIASGAGTLVNTVVWSQGSGTMLGKAASATLTTSHCLVKGQTLTGSGNIAGNVDPELRSDGRLRIGSPLRGAGVTAAQSRIDIDGELRPGTTPDIGVDQLNDGDSDGLPDAWESANVGNTTSTLGSADADNDQLSNSAEYDLESNWLDPDMDKDGLLDGVEVAIGTNVFVTDSDELSTDVNHDGLIDSIGAQLGYQPNQLDSDGDSLSNADELLMCTNPLRIDSDGDGMSDDSDPFPLEPLMSSLPSDPQDATPPVITLTAPWYAVEQ